MEMDLCRPCAEKMRDIYMLVEIRSGVDNKITCARCEKKRYGSTYEVTSVSYRPSE